MLWRRLSFLGNVLFRLTASPKFFKICHSNLQTLELWHFSWVWSEMRRWKAGFRQLKKPWMLAVPAVLTFQHFYCKHTHSSVPLSALLLSPFSWSLSFELYLFLFLTFSLSSSFAFLFVLFLPLTFFSALSSFLFILLALSLCLSLSHTFIPFKSSFFHAFSLMHRYTS